jgi:hypothetical protein
LPEGSSAGGDVVERQRAGALLDAFASGADSGATPDCSFGANHDFAACGMDPIPNPVLFAKEEGDVDAIDRNDVQQNDLLDCHLMAPLAALAGTPEGRALIGGMIREGKNERGETTYTVTFHKPESHWFGLGKKTFSEVSVTVSGPYVTGHAEARNSAESKEVWPLVIEKAYAAYCGSYRSINKPDSPKKALEILTGREAEQTFINWFSSYSAEQLRTDIASGKCIIFQTKTDLFWKSEEIASPNDKARMVGSHHLVNGHAYTLTGTQEINGRLYLRLDNPWRSDQPELVPFDELSRWFSAVTTGSVK